MVILSSSNRTNVVLGCVDLVSLETVGIDVRKNSIVSASRSLIFLSKYSNMPFI